MLNIYDILTYLDTNNASSITTQCTSVPQANLFDTTNNAYSSDNLLDQLLYCLYHEDISTKCNCYDIYDREYVEFDKKKIQFIKKQILYELENNTSKQLNNINKRKIIQLIQTNEYNHEIILLFGIIYDVNIFVYYCDINLFKVYYLEDNCCKKKKNIFIQFGKGKYSNCETFQRMTNVQNKSNILDWSYIQQFVTGNISSIYAIGINETKIFKISDDDYIRFERSIEQINDTNLALSIFSKI